MRRKKSPAGARLKPIPRVHPVVIKLTLLRVGDEAHTTSFHFVALDLRNAVQVAHVSVELLDPSLLLSFPSRRANFKVESVAVVSESSVIDGVSGKKQLVRLWGLWRRRHGCVQGRVAA